MKPERIQIFERLRQEIGSFAANLRGALLGIELWAREMRTLLGLNDDDS